jgi:hypothetical protein
MQPSEKRRKLLISRGVPWRTFNYLPNDYTKHFVSIVEDTDKKPLNFSKTEQLDWWNTINNKYTPSITVINSTPHDMLAKAYAQEVMWSYYNKGVDSKMHMVDGSFKDSIRDGNTKVRNNTLLCLYNITEQSSNVKLEKIRDIIEYCDNHAILLVCSYNNPFHLIKNQLRIPTNGLLNIKAERVYYAG